MKCGQEIQIVGPDGAVVATAVSQCGGLFRMITYGPALQLDASWHLPFRNGYVLYGWPELLKGLIWLIAHPASSEHSTFAYITRTARDLYVQVNLIPQVRASELAALLDAPLDEVRRQLHDWVVVPGPEKEADDGDDC